MDASARQEPIAAGPVEVRASEYTAYAGPCRLELTVRELALLTALVERVGRIVSREELYATVWGRELRSKDRSVDVYVRKLRAKLAGALPGWRFIHTHVGFGYRFSPEGPASGAHSSHGFHTSATQG